MPSTPYRFGLWGKLVLAILAAGTIPIVVGLTVAYVRGSDELQNVIGASFQALAEDSAHKVDAEIQRIMAFDRALANRAAGTPELRAALHSAPATSEPGRGSVGLVWPPDREAEPGVRAVQRSWITTEEPAATANAPATLAWLDLDSTTQRHLLRISTPVQAPQDAAPLGWLHRDYDVKELLDPLVYPIRFGETGHVMLVDNLGEIISCPLLITGSRIDDQGLISLVADERAGWISAESDGHGARAFSIVGYAPLTESNAFLRPPQSWHMFVWQDSREIFAPARSLLFGIALAGALSIGLLVALGYYASRRIVKPIRQLRQEASLIAAGNLNHPLAIRTGDEIEELAGEFDEMRVQLRQLIGTLEDKVEQRTHELMESQAEKERVIDQLIQAEKVAAIGTMASGIGHEINNPLYAITGMAEAIRDENDVSACNEYGRDIIKHAQHIASIVKNLSGYIRPASRHELEPVDVNEQLQGALAMARRSLLDDRIEIRQHLAPLPNISAKREEIQQVFFNVIRNALQAMQDKGVLEVTTDRHDHRVEIRIRDTGIGIPTANLGKIFDPFFTTKGPDEGEGLGMYIVKQIVNKYDGTISLESEQDIGTTVTIQFPAGERNSKEEHHVTQNPGSG